MRRPTVARLEITETNGDRINEKTIGASQNRKRRSNHAIPTAHTNPNSSCEPWRLNASPQEVESSSRCGEFHTTSQPRNALTTKTVWNSMRTGASSTENSTSSSNDNVTRQKPPYSFVPLHQISKMLNNFGRNNSTMVEAKSAIASSGRHCGHTGNNCRGCRKYCGSVNAWTTCNAVESARNINHSGAER